MRTSLEIMKMAWNAGTVIPSFNVPHHPMLDPLVKALCDSRSFGFIAVARPEWIKFQAGSPKAIYELYQEYKIEEYTRLHLDHVPVIDEDGQGVDFESIIGEALDLGFDSVMVDGSRLSLEENIEATRRIVDAAHGTPSTPQPHRRTAGTSSHRYRRISSTFGSLTGTIFLRLILRTAPSRFTTVIAP